MKVLHLSAVKNFGGGENHIINLCKQLNGYGKIKNIVLSARKSGIPEILRQNNIQTDTADLSIKFDPRYIFKTISLCQQENVDLIHIHDSTALTLAVMATKLASLPPFILSKKTSFPIKQRSRTLYKYNHPKIKKILCVSDKTRQITAESINASHKLITVYHGTSLDKETEPKINLRKRFKISDAKIIVGTIANHIRAKNLETWIKVVDYLVNKRKIEDFHFVQIGSYTPRTPVYLKLIEDLKLSDYITFTGFIENASAMIPQFDISLLTSQSEGIPQFIYESFYYKTAVVSTNVGGIPEVIEDSENGMLSNPYEVQSLADKLIALSRDKFLREKFTERSYHKLIENFTTSKMADQTLAIYKDVLYGKN